MHLVHGNMRSALPCILLLFIIPLCRLIPTLPLPCGKNEKQCEGSVGKCITVKQICDGIPDCPYDTDEVDCKEEMPTFEEFMEMEYLFCSHDEFKCSNGKCIALNLVCNGENDCPRGEDEGGLCDACEEYGCGDKCQNFPTGPRCTCPSDMFLSVDGLTCEFEERCSVGGQHNCSQHCKQVRSHVSCFCSDGFSLVNNYDCELKEEHRDASLFILSNDSAVYRYSLFGNSSEVLSTFVPQSNAVKRITSLTFNRANDKLYFVSDEGHRHAKIFASNGIESRSLYFGFGIKHIAADWVTNNIYYVADGLGIGVCRGDGRFCSLLIAANRPLMDDKEHFGNLIVHPKRGILIWLHYNEEHPNGVIMAAGMDGKKTRILTQLTASHLSTLAIDYVMDRLYFVENSQLYFLDLHTLLKHSVKHLNAATSMVAFNGYLYYVSSSFFHTLNKFNEKTKREEPISQNSFNGLHFLMSINNSVYYENLNDPCEKLDCSHMCVLSETGSDKILKARCICPDKYIFTDNGICLLDSDAEGPVRTSVANMEAMCADGHACHNGGTCPIDLTNTGDATPFCDCAPGFNGLYCEIRLPGKVSEGSSVLFILLLLFMFVIIAIAAAVFALKMYPNMRHRFESFSNINVSPSIDRTRSRNTLLRQKDNSVAPMLTRSPSANFSPSSLLRNADQAPRPIQITNSFSNPSFSTPTSQQRLDEEQIEREIQVNCSSLND